MSDFNKIIPLTIKYEGEEYTNIPEDAGGPTKYGIALNTFAKYHPEIFDLNNDGVVNIKDIKQMTLEAAIKGFKKHMWDNCNLDEIGSNKCAFVLFDAAVNSGRGGMSLIAQRTCNKLGFSCNEDGKYGPQTRNTILLAINKYPEDFPDIFLIEREQFFRKIVERKPSQRIFLRGWLNRIKNIRSDMESL